MPSLLLLLGRCMVLSCCSSQDLRGKWRCNGSVNSLKQKKKHWTYLQQNHAILIWYLNIAQPLTSKGCFDQMSEQILFEWCLHYSPNKWHKFCKVCNLTHLGHWGAHRHRGFPVFCRPDRKCGCHRFFSPTFINPCFWYSPIVNIKTPI